MPLRRRFIWFATLQLSYTRSIQDSIIYAASGRGILLTSPEGESDAPERHEIAPGDFVFVPAWTEHRLLNETGEEVVWVVVRSGGAPVQVDLTHWGGPEIKRAPRARAKR